MPISHTPDNLPCPRCDSIDTKFCYFNNYSTSQPRYFCKNCKRYWTAGGSLRNVPIGGGVRKKSKKARRTKQVHDLLLSSSSSAAAGESGPRRAGLSSRNSDLSHIADPQTPGNPSSTSVSAERDAEYETSTGNAHTSRGFGTPLSGRRAESVAESQNAYDFYNYITPCVAPVHYGFLDSGKFQAQEFHQDGSFSGHHGRNGPDLTRSNSIGDTPEVSCTKNLQMGSGDLKDHSSSGTVMGIHSFYHQDQGQDVNRKSLISHNLGHEQPNGLEEPLVFEESQYRDKSQTEDDEDDLGDVVNVRYPFDWDQVSEVLFGVTPDFLYLPGH